MKIREQNSQRLVIAASSRWWLLPPVLILAVCIPIVIVFHVHLDGWLMALLIGLIGYSVIVILAQSAYARVTMDKPNERISVRKSYLWLVPRRRNIPFSAVMSVDVDHKLVKRLDEYSSPSWYHVWRVSLNTGDKKIKVHQTGSEADVQSLAWTMRRFIGQEQLLERQKEATRAKEAAKEAGREEALVSFKRRMEEAAKERKKEQH